MTRRALLGLIAPMLGMSPSADGFVVSGVLQRDSDPGYYGIGSQTVALYLDPDRAPSMFRAAESLVGTDVELVLRKG